MVLDAQARLADWRDIAPEVRHFYFEIPGIQRFEFAPGQFVSVTDMVSGKRVTRAYSIASAPDGNRFELSLNRVQDGRLSPHLFRLVNGDAVHFKGPYGSFTLRDPAREAVFVAHGTGVAPFRSMLLARLPINRDRRFTLLFGCRHEESLLYQEEFERLEREHPNFRFLPTLSRPSERWTGRRGRVQAHLEETVREARGADVYLCGLAEMVREVRERLAGMGFDRGQVLYERYS